MANFKIEIEDKPLGMLSVVFTPKIEEVIRARKAGRKLTPAEEAAVHIAWSMLMAGDPDFKPAGGEDPLIVRNPKLWTPGEGLN